MIVSSAAVDPRRVLDDAIAALRSPEAELPLEDVDRALTVAPHDPRLWHVKGLIHRAQEKRELALPALERAAQLAPSEAIIVRGLARTKLEAGLPCVDDFAGALKVAPNDPDLVKGLVAALAADGRSDEAVAGLEQALRRSPLWTDGHVLLAQMRWAEGDRKGFTRSFDEALTHHPNSFELRREQLVALVEAEHFDDAMARIEQGRRLWGEHILFTSHEAAIRSESGDIEGGDRLFAELAPLDFANLDMVPADLSYRRLDIALDKTKRPTRRLATLLRPLRDEYAYVILDCAPILAVAETRILVKHADTTVIVARAGRSAVSAVRHHQRLELQLRAPAHPARRGPPGHPGLRQPIGQRPQFRRAGFLRRLIDQRRGSARWKDRA